MMSNRIEKEKSGLMKEYERIRWPKRKKMINGFINVITIVGLFIAFFLIIDFVLSWVISIF